MGAGQGKTRRTQAAKTSSEAAATTFNKVIDFASFKKQFPKLADNFQHYPKILTLEKAPEAIQGKVEISEKVHGSNFRFMVAPDGFVVGSRRMLLQPDATSKQPKSALDYVRGSQWLAELREQYPIGTVFYGEVYGKGLSRGMAYSGHETNVRLFNIRLNSGEWVSAHNAETEEEHLVPLITTMTDPTMADLEALLPGSKIHGATDGHKEGLVVKNYENLDKHGKPVWAKIVRKDFREDINRRQELTAEELSAQSLAKVLYHDVVTDARCQKALERASEGAELAGRMDDLRLLVPALHADLEEECGDELRAAADAGMDEEFFRKSSTKHLARWYQQLLKDTGKATKGSNRAAKAAKPLVPAAIDAKKYAQERFPSLMDEVDMLCIEHPGKKDLQLQAVNKLPKAEREAGLLILDGRIGEAEQALEKAALQQALEATAD